MLDIVKLCMAYGSFFPAQASRVGAKAVTLIEGLDNRGSVARALETVA